MHVLCWLLALGLQAVWGNPTPAAAQALEACTTLPASKQLPCYQQRFTAADRELNAVYQHLTTTIEMPRKQAMKEQSRRWIEYKEAHCLEATGIALSLDLPEVKRRPEYLECLYDLTVARTAYLKKAFGQEGVAPGLAGAYDDGFGGTLTLRASGSDTYTFQLEVVRGPTFHTGEVEGRIRLPAKTATFVQKTDCGGDIPCCRLTFTRQPLFLRIASEGCEYLHGARAYFPGNYWKVQ
ncbi:MAG: lysozyme inhibitor LprI family protein [Candidatus Tectimicrobiota bacterium]